MRILISVLFYVSKYAARFRVCRLFPGRRHQNVARILSSMWKHKHIVVLYATLCRVPGCTKGGDEISNFRQGKSTEFDK